MPRYVDKKKKTDAKKIVSKRILLLIEQAEQVARKELPLANRYIEMARNLSMRFNVAIPSNLRRKFCKHCHTFLLPGLNLTVRTNQGKVVYTCKSCDMVMRIPFTREKLKK